MDAHQTAAALFWFTLAVSVYVAYLVANDRWSPDVLERERVRKLVYEDRLYKRQKIVLRTKPIFYEVVSQVPVDARFQARWAHRTAAALLVRAMELIRIIDDVSPEHELTFMKFSKGLVPQKTFKAVEFEKKRLDEEVRDVYDWAQKLLPGWDIFNEARARNMRARVIAPSHLAAAAA